MFKDEVVVGVTRRLPNGQQSEMSISNRGNKRAALCSERVRAEYRVDRVETGGKRIEVCGHCCHSNLLRWRWPCLDVYHCLKDNGGE